MTDYRVALDVYNGPMDLLLFLIKREEIDIYDIPIAHITEQYLQYVGLLRELDPEVIGDFLVLAATLMEIKSRSLLPRPPVVEDDEELADPRLELVRQLLEYKKFKDAAYSLDEAAADRARQHARVPVVPPEPEDATDLESLEVWDLFEAFNRLLEQTGRRGAYHQVSVDDTPITLHAEDILDSLQHHSGEQQFEEIFVGRNRGEMIGLFLALLELIRQHRVRVRQDSPSTTLLVTLLDATPLVYHSFGAEDEVLDATAALETDSDSNGLTEAGNIAPGKEDRASQSVGERVDESATDAEAPSGDEAPDAAMKAVDGIIVDAAEAPVDGVLSDTGQAMKSSTDPLPSFIDMPPDRARLATPAHGAAPAQALTPRRADDTARSMEECRDDHEDTLVADAIDDGQSHTHVDHEPRVSFDADSPDDADADRPTSETNHSEREHPHDTK